MLATKLIFFPKIEKMYKITLGTPVQTKLAIVPKHKSTEIQNGF